MNNWRIGLRGFLGALMLALLSACSGERLSAVQRHFVARHLGITHPFHVADLRKDRNPDSLVVASIGGGSIIGHIDGGNQKWVEFFLDDRLDKSPDGGSPRLQISLPHEDPSWVAAGSDREVALALALRDYADHQLSRDRQDEVLSTWHDSIHLSSRQRLLTGLSLEQMRALSAASVATFLEEDRKASR